MRRVNNSVRRVAASAGAASGFCADVSVATMLVCLQGNVKKIKRGSLNKSGSFQKSERGKSGSLWSTLRQTNKHKSVLRNQTSEA